MSWLLPTWFGVKYFFKALLRVLRLLICMDFSNYFANKREFTSMEVGRFHVRGILFYSAESESY